MHRWVNLWLAIPKTRRPILMQARRTERGWLAVAIEYAVEMGDIQQVLDP